jgi:hypothetical protein
MGNIYKLLVILFLLYFLFCLSNQIDTFINTKDRDIQLVIARYNENLKWLNDKPYNKYRNIIYNKSDNTNFNTNSKTEKIVKLENVGRCDHTYLYHIIQNYDNLADITVFLTGSINLRHKNRKATRLLNEIERHKQNVFLGNKYNNVQKDLYNFRLNYYGSSEANNHILNSETKLELAPIRPFGKWYKDKFNGIHIEYVSYAGIFSVDKKEILQHPKSYYENLIKELEKTSNPEVGHYFERSWNAIFYPMTETIFIKHNIY